MKKIMFASIASVICVLAVFALVFSLIENDRIQHSRQFLVPMEGRVNAYANYNMQLTFYFLDEKPLSELSQKENIRAVLLVTSDGDTMKAKDWEVSQEGFLYTGSKYASKELTVTISPQKSIEFREMILQYADKEERFRIGHLKVDIIPRNAYEPFMQIWSTIAGEGIEPFIAESDELLDFKETLSYGVFSFIPNRATRILDIDLGISDLYVDPGSLKQIPQSFDFGSSMTDDPAYKDYLTIQQKSELGATSLDLKVENDITYLSRLSTSRKSMTGLEILVISPRFRCLDIESGNEFIYANTNFSTVGIHIISDRLALELLEEEGR